MPRFLSNNINLFHTIDQIKHARLKNDKTNKKGKFGIMGIILRKKRYFKVNDGVIKKRWLLRIQGVQISSLLK